MRVVYSNGKVFAGIIDLIGKFFDEAYFDFKEDGLIVKGLDPSRVIYVEMRIPKEDFEFYEIDEKNGFGVDMEKIRQIMRRVKSKDSVEIEADGDGFVTIKIKGKSKRIFRIGEIDVEETELDLPDLPFTVEAKISGKTIKDIVSDVKGIGEALSIIADPEEYKLIFTSESETSDYKAEIGLEDESLFDLNIDNVAKSTYGLSYLIDIFKNSSSEVILRFGNDMPLMVEQYDGRVKILLAPRVED